MKRLVKVTIGDFAKVTENLNEPSEAKLYEAANGKTYEAEIEPDGYAVIDLSEDEYIELAPSEYQIMIAEWKVVGTSRGVTIETKSDPDDDAALLYRGVDQQGTVVEAPQSLPKELVDLLAKAWFGSKKSGTSE